MRRNAVLHVVLFATVAVNPGCGCESNPNGTEEDLGAPGDDAGTSGDGSVMCLGLTGISIAPNGTTIHLDGNAPAPVNFTITGTFPDGHTETIDHTKFNWTATRADDTPAGMMGSGTLSPNGQAGGTVTITATDGCVSATTTITFFLDVSVGTPSNPAAWMGTPVSTGTVPLVVYPSDQTRFPRNIYRTLFQWRTSGYTEFRLTFTGPSSKVTIYTDGAHMLCMAKNPAAGCWEAGEAAWSFIAGSNAGQTVSWTVDALDNSTVPATVRRAAPITLGFSKRDVLGAIFYWSTTSAGIRRANIRDAVPEDYLTGKPATTYSNPTDQVKCVACHVVSRDGKYLVAPVQAMSGQSLWITEVTKGPPPTPLVKSIANTNGHGFATISPDNKTVAAAWGGKIWTVDRATGAYGADLPLGALKGTHPDWSPDNTQLAFSTGSGDAPGNAALALIAYVNPTWGTPTTLVAATGQSNLFPSFSPDGKWLAYSRGKGGHGDASAQLWLVRAQVGGMPVEMIAANRVISNKTTTGQFENTQPTWAPPGDLDWVAFNSQREYGVVSQSGTQQIWVAAVETGKAPGADPSYPAFRLQFQGLNENNHRAYWTLDVRDPPPDGGVPDMAQPPADLMCIMSGQTCDPVLDTCCQANETCDTNDNGLTYSCIMKIQ
jgi:hypothetical protein